MPKSAAHLFRNVTNRYEEAEKEFHKMKLAMKDKDDLIEREREELRHLLQDLTDMVKQHKARIVELTEINKQQEIVLKSQSQSLDSKEEQMEMSYREVEALQRKCMELEGQASVLKKSLEELQIMKQESDSIFEEKASKERRSFEERQAVLERNVQDCRAERDGGGAAAPVETAHARTLQPRTSRVSYRDKTTFLRSQLYLRIWCKEKRLL
uniref:Uncharacterized protein n=1 Tax=Timema poppense TaxID=170557 RepID=A0A7R9DTI2_TIMPO|nr:unnamed protein product [Timema poppensis]